MEEFKEKLAEVYFGGDYDSEFEFDISASKKRKNLNDLVPTKPSKSSSSKVRKQAFVEEYNKEQARIQRYHFLSKDAYTRHKELINDYVLCYRGSTSKLARDRSKDKTDHDVIKENHKFLWDDDTDESPETWEKQLAKKYYNKLFKEYCLADLSRYKENKVAMRWRTETEVIEGKGQFSCGHIRCNNKDELKSWEVNFGYIEESVKKNALVKIRLCPKCSFKLNYHHKRKEVTKVKELPSSDKHQSKRTRTSDDLEQSVDDVEALAEPLNISAEEEEIHAPKKPESTDNDIWKKPVPEVVESTKNRDNDFEQYLADMLL